jgi:hypothetical protein
VYTRASVTKRTAESVMVRDRCHRLAVILGLVLLLSGCGPSATPTPAPTPISGGPFVPWERLHNKTIHAYIDSLANAKDCHGLFAQRDYALVDSFDSPPDINLLQNYILWAEMQSGCQP